MTLEEERRILDEQKKRFEQERIEFSRRVELEDKRLAQQQQLFDMKVKILEEELIKLAAEKEAMRRKREFYSRVDAFEKQSTTYYAETQSNVINGEMFFSGVGSKQSIKKRYKDLIKIYHPDNVGGDNDTIQEINSEYSKLCAMYNI